MTNFKVSKEQLERLEEFARRNEKGLSNFVLIEHKNKSEHFVFRVVCERITQKEQEVKE